MNIALKFFKQVIFIGIFLLIITLGASRVFADAPNATNLSAAETYTEDVTLNLVDIVTSDIDGGSLTATLTLSSLAAGSLSTATSGAVTSTYNGGTGVWTATGAIADVNTLLAGVSFVPATNYNSSFTIVTNVSDGTDSVSGTKIVTGTAVNDAPILDSSKSPVMSSVAENAGVPTGAVGTPISSLVDFTLPAGGLDNVTDADSGPSLGIAITSIDTTNLSCYYSINSGSSWTMLGVFSDAVALLVSSDSTNRIYCHAGTGVTGTFPTAITFRAWDRTSGSSGSLGNTTTNGGTTAFSTATDNASITITAAPDTTPPTVQSVTPADGTTGTAIDVPLVITFSEAMNPSSITVSSGPCDETCPAYDQVWSSGNTVLTLNIDGLFTANTEYTIEIGGEDANGNSMTTSYSWSFTTYVPLVLTEVTPIPSQVTAANAIYYFSSNDNPEDEAEYLSDACSAPEGDNVEVLVDPIAHTYFFRGLVVGHTYDCLFQMTSLYRGTSNMLRVGPFTVIAPPIHSSTGYNPSFMPQSVSVSTSVVAAIKPKQVCPSEQILTQNLRAPSRNGRYNSYTRAVVTDVKTLQTHLNRLGFGPVSIDGILGIKSDSAIKKLQTSLGVKADGFIGAKTREVINNSCTI